MRIQTKNINDIASNNSNNPNDTAPPEQQNHNNNNTDKNDNNTIPADITNLIDEDINNLNTQPPTTTTTTTMTTQNEANSNDNNNMTNSTIANSDPNNNNNNENNVDNNGFDYTIPRTITTKKTTKETTTPTNKTTTPTNKTSTNSKQTESTKNKNNNTNNYGSSFNVVVGKDIDIKALLANSNQHLTELLETQSLSFMKTLIGSNAPKFLHEHLKRVQAKNKIEKLRAGQVPSSIRLNFKLEVQNSYSSKIKPDIDAKSDKIQQSIKRMQDEITTTLKETQMLIFKDAERTLHESFLTYISTVGKAYGHFHSQLAQQNGHRLDNEYIGNCAIKQFLLSNKAQEILHFLGINHQTNDTINTFLSNIPNWEQEEKKDFGSPRKTTNNPYIKPTQIKNPKNFTLPTNVDDENEHTKATIDGILAITDILENTIPQSTIRFCTKVEGALIAETAEIATAKYIEQQQQSSLANEIMETVITEVPMDKTYMRQHINETVRKEIQKQSNRATKKQRTTNKPPVWATSGSAWTTTQQPTNLHTPNISDTSNTTTTPWGATPPITKNAWGGSNPHRSNTPSTTGDNTSVSTLNQHDNTSQRNQTSKIQWKPPINNNNNNNNYNQTQRTNTFSNGYPPSTTYTDDTQNRNQNPRYKGKYYDPNYNASRGRGRGRGGYNNDSRRNNKYA